jgi:hypothetical protein
MKHKLTCCSNVGDASPILYHLLEILLPRVYRLLKQSTAGISCPIINNTKPFARCENHRRTAPTVHSLESFISTRGMDEAQSLLHNWDFSTSEILGKSCYVDQGFKGYTSVCESHPVLVAVIISPIHQQILPVTNWPTFDGSIRMQKLSCSQPHSYMYDTKLSQFRKQWARSGWTKIGVKSLTLLG